MYNIHTWKPGHQYSQIVKRGIKSETEAERLGHELANKGIYKRVEIRQKDSNFFIQAWSGCLSISDQCILI